MIPAGLGNIYLVGFMGSGKSTVGRLLAAQLGYAFLDLDSLIEASAGTSIESIFGEEGEAAFRKMESEMLKQTTDPHPHVMALGGGAFSNPDNRRLLESRGVTVWLKVSGDEAWRRCRREKGRPLAHDRQSFFRLFEARQDDYGRCDLDIAAGDDPPRDVCAELFGALLDRVES